MPLLTPEQLADVSPLGLLLLQAYEAGRFPPRSTLEFTNHLWLRLPAVSLDVGDLEIHDDESEYTVVVGRHTHHHTMVWDQEPRDPVAERLAAFDRLLTDLDSLLTDRTVIWSHARRAGGTFSIDLGPEHLEPGAEAWLWSGRRFP